MEFDVDLSVERLLQYVEGRSDVEEVEIGDNHQVDITVGGLVAADYRPEEESLIDPATLTGDDVSDASIYKWKAKFGGMDVSEAKRLKTLEHENTKLKRLLADAMLDNAALKDLLGKKW